MTLNASFWNNTGGWKQRHCECEMRERSPVAIVLACRCGEMRLPGCNLGRSITRAVMRSNVRAHCVLMTPQLSHHQTRSFQPWTPAGPQAAGTQHLTFIETAPFITPQTTTLVYGLDGSIADISIGQWWKTASVVWI